MTDYFSAFQAQAAATLPIQVNITDSDNWIARKLRRAGRKQYGCCRVCILGRRWFRMETPHGTGEIRLQVTGEPLP